MTSLPRHLSCQLVRYCANWQFYWSVCAVLALTALFAVLDVQTISSTVSITANGTVQSHDALDPNLAHIVSDAMLASPYQTSIILIPIIVALIVAAGFRSGDEGSQCNGVQLHAEKIEYAQRREDGDRDAESSGAWCLAFWSAICLTGRAAAG